MAPPLYAGHGRTRPAWYNGYKEVTQMDQSIFTAEQAEVLLQTLKSRFTANQNRHEGIDWAPVEARLRALPGKLWSLHQMEATGGEPDVMLQDDKTGEYVFADFSAETPAGRRNLCYDRAALEARKEYKPANAAMDLAQEMGVTILNEDEYRALQRIGAFDRKTSSWILTPQEIRSLGGALFCDRRYDHVFTYHNGAESYYSVRGFRAMLRV